MTITYKLFIAAADKQPRPDVGLVEVQMIALSSEKTPLGV